MSLLLPTKNAKVYVHLPANYCSGGPELGHQLIDYLREQGVEAYAVYLTIGTDVIDGHAQVPEMYRQYNIVIAREVIDDPNNVVVIPEIMPEKVREYKNAKIVIWWLSVDNFYLHYIGSKNLKWIGNKSIFENFKRNIHILLSRSGIAKYDILGFFRSQSNRIVHLYQSQYALEYILKNRLKNCYPLGDFINPELIPTSKIDHSKKENLILYNPFKGYEYTQKIIEALPEYKFVALKGFSREQLNQWFDRAKLYIDFGQFPGKDRLPRECVLHDCCIITGMYGASAFYEDVPIGNFYKYDCEKTNLDEVLCGIRVVMENYSKIILDFEDYKLIVKGEQSHFYKEIHQLFID